MITFGERDETLIIDSKDYGMFLDALCGHQNNVLWRERLSTSVVSTCSTPFGWAKNQFFNIILFLLGGCIEKNDFFLEQPIYIKFGDAKIHNITSSIPKFQGKKWPGVYFLSHPI